MAIKINKKIIFSLIIIILLPIAGGVFCWQNREIKGSPEDYVVKETPEGKIVENKKAGLTVKVPEGWIEEKIEIEESSMIFYSPDAEGYRPNKKTPPLKTGCVIEIGIMYKKINFEEIKTEIEESHKEFATTIDEIEMVSINNSPALKNTYETPFLGDETNIDIYIPYGKKVYGITLAAAHPNIEECYKKFDKFLETVSVK